MELKELMTRAFIEAVPQKGEGEAEFLNSIETDELRRAYFICLIFRMPLEELKKMKAENKTANEIERLRNEFVVKLATDLDPMSHRMNSELSRLNELIRQNRETTDLLKKDVAQAIERERSALLDQISGLKEQQKRDQMLAVQYREEIKEYKERINAMMESSRDMQKRISDHDSEEELVSRAERIKKNHAADDTSTGFLERRRRKRQQDEYEQEMDEFIKELISKEDLSREQKDYLLSALEEGYSFKIARRVMVPTLTVEQMQKFIKIYDKRMGGKK